MSFFFSNFAGKILSAMKKLILFVFCLCSLVAIGQTKVAVYVNGAEEIDAAVKQIIGSELVTAISANQQFTAVDRSTDFLNTIKQEQSEQVSGNLDDSQVQQLGQKFGVQQVCVANITPYQSKYYIQARMVDVESASVIATCREIAALQDLDEMVSVSEKISQKLIPAKVEPVEDVKEEAKEEIVQEPEQTYSKDYSVVGKQNDANCFLISIDNTGANAVATFKFVNTKESSLSFSGRGYILDNKGGKHPVLAVNGIGTATSAAVKKPAGITTFTVTFTKLPEDVSSIGITEGVENGWKWEQIALKPYGMANYYQFEDKSAVKYQELVNKDNQAKIEKGVQDLVDFFTSYNIIVVNSKSDPYIIEIEGKKIGIVPGNKVTTLQAPITSYGQLKATQYSGYLLYPTVYKYTVTKQNIGASITIRF